MTELPIPELALGAGAVWGAAWALADSKITLPARKALARWNPDSWLLALIECPACTSFWLGLLYSRFVMHLGLMSIAFAFFTMGAAFVIATWTGIGPDPQEPDEPEVKAVRSRKPPAHG